MAERYSELVQMLIDARNTISTARGTPTFNVSAEWSESAAYLLDRIDAWLDRTYPGWDRGSARETLRRLEHYNDPAGR
jgi:hypothetical protein